MSSPEREEISATNQGDTTDQPSMDVAEKKQTQESDETEESVQKVPDENSKATEEKGDGAATKEDDAAAKARERLERFKALKARAVSIYYLANQDVFRSD